MSDIYLQITETPTVVTLSAPVVSGALSSTVTVANTVTVALDANSLSALENVTVTVGAAITGTVTVANFPASQAVSLASVPTHGVTLASTTVTVSSLPSISGTVTANIFGQDGNGNPANFEIGIGGGDNVTNAIPIGFNGNNFSIVGSNNPLPISGTVTIGSLPALAAGTAQIGSVTASISNFPATQAVSLTTLPALVAGTSQIGSVTASISGTVPVSGTFFQATQPASLASLPALAAGTNQIGSVTASISGTVPISISSVTVGNSVTIGSLPALAAGTAQIGSVTASISANPSGALTTRFGSVTTANTAQITTAVTNTSRKYLFAQNISIGSVTMGIGFSPTTTQGIQLSAGSGIVFDSFCPTGAVYWLGATTGAAWSILEG